MNVYLDASVLVAMFTMDAHAARADLLLSRRPTIIVSDFAAAEFASAISRRARTSELPRSEALVAFSNFDGWIARSAQPVATGAADVATAAALLRRLDLVLRTPDALNLAIAQRVGAAFATFDKQLASSAATVGLATIQA